MTRRLGRAAALGSVIWLAVAVLAPGEAASAPRWVVAPESRVGFVASQSGQPVEAWFERFTAEIRFAPDDLAGSQVSVAIETASVNSQSRDRDQALRSADLFNAARWPTARFAADRFEAQGDDRYEAHGTLTLRDVTRPVVLPFTLTVDDAGVARATGAVTVNRLDFGVGQGQWQDTSVVADAVEIRIDLTARRASAD